MYYDNPKAKWEVGEDEWNV